jgi:hypothetical protein
MGKSMSYALDYKAEIIELHRKTCVKLSDAQLEERLKNAYIESNKTGFLNTSEEILNADPNHPSFIRTATFQALVKRKGYNYALNYLENIKE